VRELATGNGLGMAVNSVRNGRRNHPSFEQKLLAFKVVQQESGKRIQR
jgi:hypothetical protein